MVWKACISQPLLASRNSRGIKTTAIFLSMLIKSRLKGLRPFKTYTSPSPLKERDKKGESKRGEAPLQKKSSPSPCQGEGDTEDGVLKIKGVR